MYKSGVQSPVTNRLCLKIRGRVSGTQLCSCFYLGCSFTGAHPPLFDPLYDSSHHSFKSLFATTGTKPWMALLTDTRNIILRYLQEFDIIQHHWSLTVHDSLILTGRLSHKYQKQQTWRMEEDAQSHICLPLAQTNLEEALQSTRKWSTVRRSDQFCLVKLLEHADP